MFFEIYYSRCSEVGIVPGLGPGDRQFEPGHLDHMVIVAQSEERLTVDQKVMGSKPIFHPKLSRGVIG